MDVNNPLLTDGWSSLRVLYKLQHIHQIIFRYVGNSTFQITVFSGMTAISTAAKFLTNIHRLRSKQFFRVKLTKSQSQASHLVNILLLYYFLYSIHFIEVFIYLTINFLQDLPTDFAAYVRKRRFKRLELQGSTNTCIVQCKLLVRNSPKKSTKIGKGWKDFCIFNRLKEGDVIVFAAHNQMRKKKIKVYVKKEFSF